MAVLETMNTTGSKYFIQCMHMPGFSDNILDWDALKPEEKLQRPIVIQPGDRIGDMGTTGHALGPHDHLGVYTFGAPPEGVPGQYLNKVGNMYYVNTHYFLKIIAPKLR